jgi:hypothetical protein
MFKYKTCSKTFTFQKARDPVVLQVYNRLIKPHKDSFVEDDIKGLRNLCYLHNYAYLISVYSSLPALSKYTHCSIIGVPGAYYAYTASITVTKDSPYKRLFQHQ